MIVCWSLPIAIVSPSGELLSAAARAPLRPPPLRQACGNGYVLKPSDRCPTTGTRAAELFQAAGLPPGLLAVVHVRSRRHRPSYEVQRSPTPPHPPPPQGGQAVAERLLSHPSVAAVSFVGSSPVAAAVFRGAAAHGKRCQALGGAKNHLVVMPDADLARTVPALVGSCFGCAGQRCLAGSVLAPVGTRERQDAVVAAFVAAAAALRLGSGLDASTTLPPLYSAEHRDRVAAWVDRAVSEGATLALDGRGAARAAGLERGAFLGACVLDECTPAMPLGACQSQRGMP